MKNFYIEELKDGRVRYRMSYKDPLTDKVKRVTANYEYDSVRNRRKAQDELEQKIASIISGLNRSNMTFNRVYAEYVTYMQKSLKMSTARRNEATIRRILRTFPDDCILENITPATWKDHLDELSCGVPGTYNEYVTRTKAFLRWCIQNEYLQNDAVLVKLSRKPDKSKREKVADKYLEPYEATALLDKMEGMTQWQLLTRFMILSGLRIGEVAALTWADVDDVYIHVTKTCDFQEDVATSPKTITAVRDVPIQNELMDCINDIRKYDEWLGLDTDLVFPNKDGGYLHYYAYNKYLKETADTIVEKHVTTHTLRHTHVSLLFAQGLTIDEIARRVGHDGSRITKEIYLHMTEKIKKSDAERIKNVKLL